MATKTYLQLVNDVLSHLREPAVGSVSSTTYSTLIGRWVNDAKRMVEDAWDWQALQRAVNFNLGIGTRDYDLYDTSVVGTGNSVNYRSRLLRDVENPIFPQAYDVSAGSQQRLLDMPVDWIKRERDLETVANSQPYPIYFGLENDVDGVILRLWETPTGVRNWRLYMVCPQDDLTDDNTVLLAPYHAVVAIATDFALNERGEEVGEPGTKAEERAIIHIGDAIAIDAQRQPDKTYFRPG
jgi:hypothetical protein